MKCHTCDAIKDLTAYNDDLHFCDVCVETHSITKCEWCSCVITLDEDVLELELDDINYGQYVVDVDATNRDEENICLCADCVEEHANTYETCDDCGKFLQRDHDRFFIRNGEDDEKWLCEECQVSCEGCDELCRDTNEWVELMDGSMVCPECVLEYQIEKCRQCHQPVSRKTDGFEWLEKPDADGYCPDCQ